MVYDGLKPHFPYDFNFPLDKPIWSNDATWCYMDREADAAIDNYHLRMVYRTHKNGGFGYGLVYGIGLPH